MDGNATFGLEILASPWACCLLQISVLLLLAVVTIGCILKRFPGIAATIGLVVMTACVGLTLLTLVGIPRPLDLAIAPAVPVQSDVVDRSNEHPQELVNQKERSTSGLFERSMSAFFRSGNSLPSTGKPLPDSWAIVKTTAVLPMIVVVSFAFAIFRLLFGIVQIRQLVSTSQPLVDSTSQSILDQLLLDFKVDRQTAHRFSVRSFRRPGSPFVTWMTGNTIYVPRSFVNWSETEKQACLAHELSHLQRHDHVSRIVLDVARWMLWFHPLAWLLSRQTELAQELAADQLTVITTENSHRYCRALSRLALRFDAECRSSAALGVSISSNLIRRITMLEQIKFYRRPRPVIARIISALTIAVCSCVGCWTVTAQTQAPNSDQDAAVVLASHHRPVRAFSNPITQPWKDLGKQSGYFSIDVPRLVGHPDVAPHTPFMETAFNASLPKDQSKPEQNLEVPLEKINRVEGGLDVRLNFTGDNHRLNAGLGNVKIESKADVDWMGLLHLAAEIDGSRYGFPKEMLDVEKAEVKEDAQSKTLIYRNIKPAPDKELASLNTEAHRRLWSTVSGGDITAMFDCNIDPKVLETLGEDPIDQAVLRLAVDAQAVGYGFEFSTDYSTAMMRMAVLLKPGVDQKQFLQDARASRDNLIDLVGGNADPAVDEIANYKFSIVGTEKSSGDGKSGDAGLILIEGPCDTFLNPQFSDFSDHMKQLQSDEAE